MLLSRLICGLWFVGLMLLLCVNKTSKNQGHKLRKPQCTPIAQESRRPEVMKTQSTYHMPTTPIIDRRGVSVHLHNDFYTLYPNGLFLSMMPIRSSVGIVASMQSSFLPLS